jgi:hypothetical protein
LQEDTPVSLEKQTKREIRLKEGLGVIWKSCLAVERNAIEYLKNDEHHAILNSCFSQK